MTLPTYAALLLLVPLAGAPAAEDDAAAERPDCIQVREDARSRAVGYDHYVVLRSTCEREAICEVTTNVNPEAQSATVPAGGEVTILTWRGSPARTFQATVTCELGGDGE